MPAVARRIKNVAADYKARRNERVLGLPHEFTPREYQLPVMRYIQGGGKRAVCIWPRRHGKDLTWLHLHAMQSQVRVGAYWHCLPTYAQAKKSIWNAFREDGKPVISNAFPDEMLAKKPNDSKEMMLTFNNGSTFQLIGADNIDSLVGSGPVGVSFSEYAVSRPGSWDYVRPMLMENNGWAGFGYTPRGHNHGWKLYKMAKDNPNWFSQLLTVDDTGFDLSKIDEARKEGMDELLVQQEFYCSFESANVGAIFADLLNKVEADNRVEDFLHPNDGVFTSWDLGMSDSTAIWFWRLHKDGVEVIDYYEAHGQPMSHYFDTLEAKGYKYRHHWLPHDAKARTLAAGVSILDQFIQRFGADHVNIGPNLSIVDGIQAGRWLLEKKGTRFHATKCAAGLETLKAYSYRYDEEEHTFSRKPDHNYASHCGDAWRYVAVVAKHTGLIVKNTAEDMRKHQPIPGMDLQFKLDELWADREFRKGLS